jgi:hypothetical protein
VRSLGGSPVVAYDRINSRVVQVVATTAGIPTS